MILMNDVLADYLDDFIIVFLDDILIYSKTIEDHVVHLQKVLQKLQDHQLFAKASKCEIAYKSIEFLGQQVTPVGMSPTWSEDQSCARMEYAPRHKGRRNLPWIWQPLSAVCASVCWSSPPSDRVDEKGCGMATGSVLERSILPAESEIMRGTNLAVPRPEATIYYNDRCLRACNRGSAVASPRWRSATPSIHEQSTEAIREAIFNVWTWIGCRSILLPSVEALSGGLPKWSDGDDKPPTFDVHYTIGYPFSGTNEVGSTWFLPVNPTYDYVPT